MGGNKLALVLIVAFILATHFKNLDAKRFQYQENVGNAHTDGANLGGIPQELEPLRACLTKCKPDDTICLSDCVEKELKGVDPNKVKEFLESGLNVVQAVFCMLGCGPSQVCLEVDDVGMFPIQYLL